MCIVTLNLFLALHFSSCTCMIYILHGYIGPIHSPQLDKKQRSDVKVSGEYQKQREMLTGEHMEGLNCVFHICWQIVSCAERKQTRS